jgi:lysophospholipase L1-like esterase
VKTTRRAFADRARLGIVPGVAALLILGIVTATEVTTSAAGTTAAAQALPAGCSDGSPVTCHYAVAPGNYTVTASIGSSTSAGSTELWVEARRLMLPDVTTAAGKIIQYTFTVNVRQPEGQPTGQDGTGTPGLDLRFAGTHPQVSNVTVTPASHPLVVYLAGDSTVCDHPATPATGWGQILPSSVGPGAAVADYADSGESSGSFLAKEALFATMIARVAKNDLVLIQFGHNDKRTTAAAYRANLTSMISQVRAKGGIPILVTPPVRHRFTGSHLDPIGLIVNNLGVDLPAQMRAVGAAQNVPVIDLTAKSKALVESLGAAGSEKIYLRAAVDGVTDHTHFSRYGATEMAGLVVQGIREQVPSLAGFLR